MHLEAKTLFQKPLLQIKGLDEKNGCFSSIRREGIQFLTRGKIFFSWIQEDDCSV